LKAKFDKNNINPEPLAPAEAIGTTRLPPPYILKMVYVAISL